MLIDVKRFEALRSRAEQAATEKKRAEGSLEEINRRLKDEFKLKDLKAAVKERDRLQAEEARLEKEYAAKLTELESKHGEKLR